MKTNSFLVEIWAGKFRIPGTENSNYYQVFIKSSSSLNSLIQISVLRYYIGKLHYELLTSTILENLELGLYSRKEAGASGLVKWDIAYLLVIVM